jgi:hypothetical protein
LSLAEPNHEDQYLSRAKVSSDAGVASSVAPDRTGTASTRPITRVVISEDRRYRRSRRREALLEAGAALRGAA